MAFELLSHWYTKNLRPNNISWANILVLYFFFLMLYIIILTEVKRFIIICPCWKSELTIFNYLVILLPNNKILKSVFFPSNFFIRNTLHISSAVSLYKRYSSNLAIQTSLKHFWCVSFHTIKKGKKVTSLKCQPSNCSSAYRLVSFSY